MKITVKESKKSEAHDFHHVTEEERQWAQDRWNAFNKELTERGLRLVYDYASGGLFVCDFVLEGVMSPEGLPDEELKAVIEEGGFDSKALNNPPWFTNAGEYSLAPKKA